MVGLFDMVYVACPSCGHRHELQTKGMYQPYMNVFDANAVPLMAAAYIMTDDDDQVVPVRFNCVCGAGLELICTPPLPQTVALSLFVTIPERPS